MKAILLNSTLTYLHIGCYLTSLGLRKLFNSLDIDIIYEHEVNNYNFRQVLEIYNNYEDLYIIVNGEGTFHDDQEYAIALLNFLDKNNLKFLILNSQFRNMSQKYINIVKKAILLQVRTKHDLNYCKSVNLTNIFYCPDMLFFSGVTSPVKRTSNLSIFTDSHSTDASKEIHTYYHNYKLNKEWINIHFYENSNKNIYENFKKFIIKKIIPYNKYLKRKIAIKAFNINGKKSESFVLSKIISSNMIITGRYHAACLAIALNKPLFFSYSNTNKIKNLCDDFNWGKELKKNISIEIYPTSKSQYEKNIHTMETCFVELQKEILKKIESY